MHWEVAEISFFHIGKSEEFSGFLCLNPVVLHPLHFKLQICDEGQDVSLDYPDGSQDYWVNMQLHPMSAELWWLPSR